MTKPAKRHQQARVYRLQYQQIWTVFGLMTVGFVLETLGINHATKSMALGGLLGYLAQCAFTFMAYRATGAQARQAIMLNMYLGQLVKWGITLVGFALIFIFAKPIHAFLVILSYFILQMINVFMMRKI